MSQDGFLDFGIGAGDDNVGKKNRKFTAEGGRTYRTSFCWFSFLNEETKVWNDDLGYDAEGNPNAESRIRFTGCERIFVKGVGFVLYKGPAYAKYNEQPKQHVATVICNWPTNKDGELEVSTFAAGKGWQVMPFIMSTDKYETIKKGAKRFSLKDFDLSMACPEGGTEYQKLTFTPEPDSLLTKIRASDKPAMRAMYQAIIKDARACAAGIQRELARDLSIAQIDQLLGGESSPTGGSGGAGHAAKDVDGLLNDIL